jgi:hypothetical protein
MEHFQKMQDRQEKLQYEVYKALDNKDEVIES